MAKRITIDDVAKAAGVHKATVSRALNELTQSKLTPETVKKVQRAARRLGYVPNAMARGLRTSRSMTIGVVLPDLTNPIFPPIIRGIENYLQPRGYTALLANTDGHEAVEASAFKSLLERRVDGFILATGRLGEHPYLTDAFRDGVLAVMVNRDAGTTPYPLVTSNSMSGISAALNHLLELGHTNIMHIAGPMNFSTTRARAEAFAALTSSDSRIQAFTIEAPALTIEAGQHVMDELLSSSAVRPTAVIASSDLVALGVLRSLRAHAVRCPEDVSVVGFNDMPFAEDFSPPLTTVRVPLREIGAEAAQLLMRGIDAGALDPVTLALPVSLIVRGSTAAAAQRA